MSYNADKNQLPLCDRCKNYFKVRRIYNIRPYNPYGEKNEKGFVNQEPMLLCENCRKRIYDWITGNTRKLELAPDKLHGTSLDNFEVFKE